MIILAVSFVPVVGLAQVPAPTSTPAEPDTGAVPVVQAGPRVPGALNLLQAKSLALRDNPGVAAALHRVEAATAALRLAQSAYSPTVSLGANAQSVREVPGYGAGDVDPYETYDLSATVAWLAFDGFARGFRVTAARAAEAGTEEDYRDVQRLLVQGTSLAFLTALLAEEGIRIARQDADFNRELSNETRKRFDAGTAAKSDVLNFDIRTTQAESRHVTAEHAFRSAKTALAELLGIPAADLPTELVLVPPPDADLHTPLPAFDDEWAFAQLNRPDLMSLQHRADQLRAQYAATRTEYLPRVSLQGGTGVYRTDDARFNWERDNSVYGGVTATWDVFTGHSTRYVSAQLAAQARELEAQAERLRLAIAADLRQRLDTNHVARRQLTLNEQISRMTSEVRDLVRIEYSAGRTSLTRLNEAQTDLVRASGELAFARIHCWQALENLAAAAGRNLR